jgi:hypothetical protein
MVVNRSIAVCSQCLFRDNEIYRDDVAIMEVINRSHLLLESPVLKGNPAAHTVIAFSSSVYSNNAVSVLYIDVPQSEVLRNAEPLSNVPADVQKSTLEAGDEWIKAANQVRSPRSSISMIVLSNLRIIINLSILMPAPRFGGSAHEFFVF